MLRRNTDKLKEALQTEEEEEEERKNESYYPRHS
jgi:hypothetical protein